MATNKDSLFLAKADLTDFRDISANIADEKINIFIREAQSIEARGFLGNSLWYLMQNDWNGTDFDDDRFNDLWFGADYTNKDGETIRFNGYISAVSYFTYARFLKQQQVNVSRFGVESVQNEISEDISNAQVRSKEKDALQVAFNYQNDTECFLLDKDTIYPEYNNARNTTPRKTSLSFFKL